MFIYEFELLFNGFIMARGKINIFASRFNKALAIRQVGGKSAGKFVKVGNGLFTRDEVFKARVRFGEAKTGRKFFIRSVKSNRRGML